MARDGGLELEGGAVLYMWTVYDSPRDYPGKFVARQFAIRRGDPEPRPTHQVVIAGSLDLVRRMLPPGLYREPRSEGDDPVIVETWF